MSYGRRKVSELLDGDGGLIHRVHVNRRLAAHLSNAGRHWHIPIS